MMNASAGPSLNHRQAMREAWIQYGFVVASLVAMGVCVGIVISPSLYAYVVEYALLPGYESGFGFRGERISLKNIDESYTRYAIVEITPGGVLDNAGVGVGDIPIDNHGGMVAFYAALSEASQGSPAEFEVVSREDPSWERRRTIRLSR